MNIISLLKIKFQKQNIKNFFTLLSGSVGSQIIIFVCTPILTRLFSEEIFGIYVLYSSSILLLKTISTLNYEIAIVLPKRNKDAINILILNFIILTCFFLFLTALIYTFHNQILTLLNIERMGIFIYFIPLGVFLSSVISVLNYWNNRMNSFKNIALGTISRATTLSSSQIIVGISIYNFIGLIPGLLIGQITNLIVIIKLSFKSYTQLKHHISLNRIFFLAKKYKDIPLFNTLLSFTETLSNELPVLLITKYFGLAPAAFYGLAQKLTKTPIAIIGNSANQIFVNNASQIFNKQGNLYQFVTKSYKHLFLTSLPIYLLLFIISFFLKFIFGKEWEEVGIFVRIIIPWLLLTFINTPIGSIVVILNKQKEFLLYEIILLTARFLCIYAGYIMYNNILVSLIYLSSIGFLFGIFCFFYFIRISKPNNI